MSLAVTITLLVSVLVSAYVVAFILDRRYVRRIHDIFTPKFFAWENPRLYAAFASFMILQCGTYGGFNDENGDAKACSPSLTAKAAKGVVKAEFTANCDPSPQSHHIRLELQHKDRKDMPYETMNAAQSSKVPRPGQDVTISIAHMCFTGWWKAYVRVTGHGPKEGRPFSYDETQKVNGDGRVKKA